MALKFGKPDLKVEPSKELAEALNALVPSDPVQPIAQDPYLEGIMAKGKSPNIHDKIVEVITDAAVKEINQDPLQGFGDQHPTILTELRALQAGKPGTLMLVHNESGKGYEVLWCEEDRKHGGFFTKLRGPDKAKLEPKVTQNEVPRYRPVWR